MNDARELLEQATRSAPVPPADAERLYARGDARKRRSRVSAAIVAVAIAIGGSSLAVNAVGGSGGAFQSGAGDQIGAPTQDLSMSRGDFYYQRFDGGWGVCESWWTLDDSGRLDSADKSPEGSCWGPPQGKTYDAGQFYSDSGPVAGLSTNPDELLS